MICRLQGKLVLFDSIPTIGTQPIQANTGAKDDQPKLGCEVIFEFLNKPRVKSNHLATGPTSKVIRGFY
jgi:hypothetical protein